MVAQLELQRMGIEIGLLLEIGLVIFAHVMVEQGYGHDQRNMSILVLAKNFK